METSAPVPLNPPRMCEQWYSRFAHDKEDGLWPRSLTIAAAQARSVCGDVRANVAKVVEMLDQAGARGIHIVVFPEKFLAGLESDLVCLDPAEYAIHPKDARLDPIVAACRRNEVAVIVGATTVDNARLYSSTLAFNATGDLMARYHKQHLSDSEQDIYERGDLGNTLQWSQWRLGLGLGRDSASHAHARDLAEVGCQVYVVGALLGEQPADRESHDWLSARARDNGMYVLMATDCATAVGSAIWDPTGAVAAQAAPHEEQLLAITLDFLMLSPARQREIPREEYAARQRSWPRFERDGFEPMDRATMYVPLHNAAVPLWEIEAINAIRATWPAPIEYPPISDECEAECDRLLDLIIAADIEALEREAAINDQFPNGIDVTWSDEAWIARAINYAPIEVVAWMIAKGVDLSVVDGEGYTLLFVAIDLEKPEKYAKLELLLRSGTPTDIHGTNDWTAAHMAAWRNDVEALRLLRKYGADLRALSFDDAARTPLEDARHARSWKAAAFIEQALLEDARDR